MLPLQQLLCVILELGTRLGHGISQLIERGYEMFEEEGIHSLVLIVGTHADE